MKLFPRIDDSPALREMVGSLAISDVEHCRQHRSTWHQGAWYGPSGEDQIGADGLQRLAEALAAAAASHGYPGTDHRDTRGADIDMSIILYQQMEITPIEATAGGIWNFLACIAVPDVVTWRFPTKDQAIENANLDRWVVGRRWYRHAFGRLWWRACMFRDHHADGDPWHLMRLLQEDEFIQLLERPHLVGYSEAVLELVRAMLKIFKKRSDLNRGTLMRIAAKRLLRLGAVIDLHALDRDCLEVLMEEIASAAVTTLEGAHVGSARG